MVQKRQRGRNIAPEVYPRLEELAQNTRSTAPQIEAVLHKEFGGKHRIPSPSQIKRVIRDLRPRDTSGPWRLADADPDEAALVLPVRFDGEHEWLLSTEEAGWIAKVRRVAPDLPSEAVLNMVWSYMSWQQRGHDTALLDLVLAGAPWRGQEHLRKLVNQISTYHTGVLSKADAGNAALRLAHRLLFIADRAKGKGSES